VQRFICTQVIVDASVSPCRESKELRGLAVVERLRRGADGCEGVVASCGTETGGYRLSVVSLGSGLLGDVCDNVTPSSEQKKVQRA
jgi:hypothetical protein